MSFESEKSINLNSQGKYDLSRIESDDPEVLDFVNEVSEQAENLVQTNSSAPEIRSFINILSSDKGEELLLEKLEALDGDEKDYDSFVKLVTDILELQRLRSQRRVDLSEIVSELAKPDLEVSRRKYLERLRDEYNRELKQDLLIKINKLVEELYKNYPDLIVKLDLSE